MSKIAVVAICGTSREFDKKYHYIIPESLSNKVTPGVRALVPFGGGNRLKEAFVFELAENSDYPGLKEIIKVVDDKPVLSENMLKLAEWMKDRYICTYSDAIKCMLPAGIGIKGFRMLRLLSYGEKLAKDPAKIVQLLLENDSQCDYEELKRISGIKYFSKHVKYLEEAGIVSISEEFTITAKEKYTKVAYLALPEEDVLFDIESNIIRKIQHIRVLEMLMETEHVTAADLSRFAGVSPSVLDTLRKQGYINFKEVEVVRDPVRHRIFEKTLPFNLTVQQVKALQVMNAMLDEGKFAEILVHGVTGSGKTEVYLQLIQSVIMKGRQAIVLVPEISLTPQMVERFRGRFGNEVAVLHSRLSPGEKYDQWRLIKEGRIKVAVGARSAVFAPFKCLGVIIIDEEHETSYKSDNTPKYRASDIAVRRCIEDNALVVYGSATPSVETYFRAEKGEIKLVEMLERANGMLMPKVNTVDMRKELDNGNRTAFSEKLSEELLLNKEKGQQTILFLNKRGYASFVLCRSCGFTARCKNCNISLTYHSHDDRLICHYCGFTTKMPRACPKCRSNYFRQFGTGTQKIEEDISRLFPGTTVIRMDMDTTTGKNSHEDILRTFREQNINVLVGTQMIAKGHDFPNVTLVGVLAADSTLNLDDYKASERTFQLVTQVAGRAGRGELEGRVVIQTYNTEDFCIISACRHDYSAFYRQEIKIRERLRYPPFTNIAVIILSSADDRLCYNKSEEVKHKLDMMLDQGKDGDLLLGPLRAPLSKIRNRYRWRIVLKCNSLEKLIRTLSAVYDGFRKAKDKQEVDLSIDINPVSML